MSDIPYQEIYSRMDINTALSELNPIEKPDRYVLECPECNKKEAWIYKGSGWISCNRRNKCGYSASLYDYIQTRDSLTPQETLLKFEELSGVEIPKSINFDPEAYKKTREDSQLREDALKYLKECLLSLDEAKGTLDYLQDKRGFTLDKIKDLEFGYINSQNELYKYLISNKDYSVSRINEVIKFTDNIGKTHKLVIPFRDSIGNLKGFTFRAIEDGIEPRYLNSTDLKKSELLFNLRGLVGDKDLIVVEGLFDALTPSSKGIDNVVALGSTSLNDNQIDLAIKHGAKTITLCLDNNEAGTKGTKSAIESLKDKDIRVYVAELPEGIKDRDELIRERDIEAFKKVIDHALLYYEYQLEQIINKYAVLENKTRLTTKEFYNFTGEIAELRATITDPKDINIFNNAFKRAREDLEIPEELFNDIVKKLQYDKDKETKRESLKKLLNETSKIEDPDKAIEIIEKGLNSFKTKRGKELNKPYSFEDWLKEMSETTTALKTGYKALDSILRIPRNAITLVAGRPGHGKTTFMYNLMLEMSEIYPDKKFYFFTYEERSKYILTKMLNRTVNKNLKKLGDYPEALTNLAFIEAYELDRRPDKGLIVPIEEGKKKIKSLIDSNRIQVRGEFYKVEDLTYLIEDLNSIEGIGAIFIDYIQRITIEARGLDIRNRINYISDEILQTAKKTDLPIILGSQFKRSDREKPTLEDLKETGNLEEDANLVLRVYNESAENRNEEVSSREVDLEITTLKNRDGEVNRKAVLSFDRYTLNIKDSEETTETQKAVKGLFEQNK